jgi:alpha-beta hydrolase superfamily lysophospholipase
MEKTSSLPGKPNTLASFFSRNKARLVGKLAPGRANSQIDSMLFIPKSANSKLVRLPRGFEQFVLKTNDGKLQAYKTGRGPCVVFVHGWGGGAHQFFPLMRGLARCGFSSLAFDHLGHGLSDKKPATLHQSIRSCNEIFEQVRTSADGLCALVGHSTGCISIASARAPLLRDLPLFLIAPIFNYKRYFLKKLVQLGLPTDMVKQYASGFSKTYRSEYQKLELAARLAPYGDCTAIAHDESDSESDVADSIAFCKRYPLTRLMLTRHTDHVRIINSESVWQELKSHLNYDDTTINFKTEILGR